MNLCSRVSRIILNEWTQKVQLCNHFPLLAAAWSVLFLNLSFKRIQGRYEFVSKSFKDNFEWIQKVQRTVQIHFRNHCLCKPWPLSTDTVLSNMSGKSFKDSIELLITWNICLVSNFFLLSLIHLKVVSSLILGCQRQRKCVFFVSTNFAHIQLLEYPILPSVTKNFRHKKAGLQYLGYRESYHKTAGGKTTEKKI